MLDRLRARPVIGGDDQQYPVDRQHPGQHVGQKPLVPGNVDKAELGAVGQARIGKAEVDRQPALFFFGQAVGVDPGQCPHQRRLAVVDMAGGGENHGGMRRELAELGEEGGFVFEAAQVEHDVAGFDMADDRDRQVAERARQSLRRRRRISLAPTGRNAKAALGNNDTGNAPLPIWLRVSTMLDFGDAGECFSDHRQAGGARRLRSRPSGGRAGAMPAAAAARRSGSA